MNNNVRRGTDFRWHHIYQCYQMMQGPPKHLLPFKRQKHRILRESNEQVNTASQRLFDNKQTRSTVGTAKNS